jgi:hypothetical protein
MSADITATTLAKCAVKIHKLIKRTREGIVEIGGILAEACKHADHGTWLAWLETEFGWSDQTARRFIHVYELSQNPKLNTVLTLDLPLGVLYQLAAPKAGEARAEVTARIEAGEKPSCTMVAEVVAKAKGNTAGRRQIDQSTPVDASSTDKPETETVPTDAETSAEQRRSYYAEADADPDQLVDAEHAVGDREHRHAGGQDHPDRVDVDLGADHVDAGATNSSPMAMAKPTVTPTESAPPLKTQSASVKSKAKKPSLVESWESSPEDRETIRALVLEEYFLIAGGNNILQRIRDAKRDDTVIADFLDALSVDGMRKAMSSEFGAQLRTAMPSLKKFKTEHAVQTGVDKNGKPIFALQGRGGRSQVH